MAQANSTEVCRDSGWFGSTDDVTKGPVQETDATPKAGAVEKSPTVPTEEDGDVSCTSKQETAEGQEDTGGKKTLGLIRISPNANNSNGGIDYYRDPSSKKVYEVKEVQESFERITSVNKEQRPIPHGREQSELTTRFSEDCANFIKAAPGGYYTDCLMQLLMTLHQLVDADYQVVEEEREKAEERSRMTKICKDFTTKVTDLICLQLQPKSDNTQRDRDPDPVEPDLKLPVQEQTSTCTIPED